MCFNAIDEYRYGPHALLLHFTNELTYVHLFCNYMLTVQQHSHSGIGGVTPQGPMLLVPFHILCWAAEVAVVLWM